MEIFPLAEDFIFLETLSYLWIVLTVKLNYLLGNRFNILTNCNQGLVFMMELLIPAVLVHFFMALPSPNSNFYRLFILLLAYLSLKFALLLQFNVQVQSS